MFCQNCGAAVEAGAAYCTKCGKPVGAQPSVVGTSDDAALRMVIPIGRSGWAIAAGYAGLLSLIPLVGVFAIVLGIVAIRDIKKHPEKHGLGRAWFGIVTGALMTPLWVFAFILAAMHKS